MKTPTGFKLFVSYSGQLRPPALRFDLLPSVSAHPADEHVSDPVPRVFVSRVLHESHHHANQLFAILTKHAQEEVLAQDWAPDRDRGLGGRTNSPHKRAIGEEGDVALRKVHESTAVTVLGVMPPLVNVSIRIDRADMLPACW